MILAKSELRKAVRSGELQFLDDEGRTLPEWFEMCAGMLGLGDEVDPVALQPASVDLTLGDHWLVPRANTERFYENPAFETEAFEVGTDTMKPVDYDATTAKSFWVPANGFVLARTRETIALSNDLFGKVEGRSSVGRLGLVVETAGVIDPGFRGTITLEIANLLPYPVLLHAGTRICQIVVSRMDGDTEGGYAAKGKYSGQIAATGSLLYKDFQK